MLEIFLLVFFFFFTKCKVVKPALTQTKVSFLLNSPPSLPLSVNSTATAEAGSQASCVTCASLLCLQGMNFIVGYLLIVTRDEEKSFWLLEALLGRILPGDLCSHPRRSPGHMSFKPVEHFLILSSARTTVEKQVDVRLKLHQIFGFLTTHIVLLNQPLTKRS